MVVSAVSILIFLSALSVGVNDAMLRNTVGLFSGHVTGMVTDETVRPLDLKVAGVDAVLKRRFIQGTVGAGNTDPPLTLCLLAPEREEKVTSYHQEIETYYTILMATHDPELTDRVDPIICLRDGRVTGEYNE